MSRPNPALLALFLLAVTALLGGVGLAKGGFFLTKHEGDTLHMLQIVFRMAEGEWPHLDFMTPIGFLAFAPIVLFVIFGVGVGTAILLAQILLAALLLPALYWIAVSRLKDWLGYLFGGLTLILTLALIYGEAEQAVSISMHYNRWAWAVAFVAIVLAVLPPEGSRADRVEGVFIGLAMAALALCKVTYFAAFAGPVALALILRGAFRTLGAAVLAGLAVALAVTLAAGPGFWGAYLGDLAAVSGDASMRPKPGVSLAHLIGAPPYLGASLTAMAAVILLRQAGAAVPGLILLLLVPGFFYVTFQNFGNDPQWLPLVGVLLLAHRPKTDLRNGLGWSVRGAMNVAAMAAFAFAAPSLFNLAYSPFRHLNTDPAEYRAMLSARPDHADLRVRIVRAHRIDGRVGLDGPGSGLEALAETADRPRTRTEFRGERLPDCELQLGMIAWYEAVAADLTAAGHAGGQRILTADTFSALWLFGDFGRLEQGAPWYYGGLPGAQSADLLLVPLCPAGVMSRKMILEALVARGVDLTELRRTRLYHLYRIGGSAALDQP